MSFKPRRDAQPEAVADVDHALPIDIDDITAVPGDDLAAAAEARPAPEAEPGLDAEPGLTAEPEREPEAEPELEAEAAEPEAELEPEPELGAEAERGAEAEFGAEATTELEPDHAAQEAEVTEATELAGPVAEEAPPPRRTHGVLIGLLVGLGFLAAAAAIIVGAFAIVSHLTHGFKKPVIITYKKSAIFSLRTGECIDPNGQQAATIIPCAKAHAAEVFATFSLPKSAWPGASAVATAASSGCGSRLTSYLNPQLAISLSTTFIYPDQVAWRTGTRKVICEVRANSGDLTGSVRGSTAR